MILTSEQCAKQPVAGQNTQQKEKKNEMILTPKKKDKNRKLFLGSIFFFFPGIFLHFSF